MFELIASLLRMFHRDSPPPQEQPDVPSPYVGRPVDASEEVILATIAECMDNLIKLQVSRGMDDAGAMMMHAFVLGGRIALADPGLGRAIREAAFMPDWKGERGMAITDQAAAELRHMIETRTQRA